MSSEWQPTEAGDFWVRWPCELCVTGWCYDRKCCDDGTCQAALCCPPLPEPPEEV